MLLWLRETQRVETIYKIKNLSDKKKSSEMFIEDESNLRSCLI